MPPTFTEMIEKAMRLSRRAGSTTAEAYLQDEFEARGISKGLANGMAEDVMAGRLGSVKEVLKKAFYEDYSEEEIGEVSFGKDVHPGGQENGGEHKMKVTARGETGVHDGDDEDKGADKAPLNEHAEKDHEAEVQKALGEDDLGENDEKGRVLSDEMEEAPSGAGTPEPAIEEPEASPIPGTGPGASEGDAALDTVAREILDAIQGRHAGEDVPSTDSAEGPLQEEREPASGDEVENVHQPDLHDEAVEGHATPASAPDVEQGETVEVPPEFNRLMEGDEEVEEEVEEAAEEEEEEDEVEKLAWRLRKARFSSIDNHRRFNKKFSGGKFG